MALLVARAALRREESRGGHFRADFPDRAFDASRVRKWLPVAMYIGGNEHAVLHLLYARFLTMVLRDAGLLDFEEPFTKFRAHGLIIRDGAKMSKSKGNVVVPDVYIDEWGADTFRTYMMFLGPFEEGGDFRDAGISGVRRFLDRVWASVRDARTDGEPDADVLRKLHQTIRKVGEDIPKLQYNTAIAAMMEYVNHLRRAERTPHRDEVLPLVQLVAPYAPHLAEACWAMLGHSTSVFDAGWPTYDAAQLALRRRLCKASRPAILRARRRKQPPQDCGICDRTITSAKNSPNFSTVARSSGLLIKGASSAWSPAPAVLATVSAQAPP